MRGTYLHSFTAQTHFRHSQDTECAPFPVCNECNFIRSYTSVRNIWDFTYIERGHGSNNSRQPPIHGRSVCSYLGHYVETAPRVPDCHHGDAAFGYERTRQSKHPYHWRNCSQSRWHRRITTVFVLIESGNTVVSLPPPQLGPLCVPDRAPTAGTGARGLSAVRDRRRSRASRRWCRPDCARGQGRRERRR